MGEVFRHYLVSDAVGDWWCEQLNSGKFFDDGDVNSPLGLVLKMMGADANRPSKEKLEVFKAELVSAIDEELERYGSVRLSVDYKAEGILSTCANLAGIYNDTGSAFPTKTHMRVTKEAAEVSLGFNSPYIMFFPKQFQNNKDNQSFNN